MAAMTIREIDEALKARLRVRAARHGRSMEEEARDILRAALARDPEPARSMASAIRERVAKLGGVELALPPREPGRDPIDFGA